VPEEAEAVRTIFALYLELGSMGALLVELDRRDIRTKVNGRRDGAKGRRYPLRRGVARSSPQEPLLHWLVRLLTETGSRHAVIGRDTPLNVVLPEMEKRIGR
jgi:hypothetical protein